MYNQRVNRLTPGGGASVYGAQTHGMDGGIEAPTWMRLRYNESLTNALPNPAPHAGGFRLTYGQSESLRSVLAEFLRQPDLKHVLQRKLHDAPDRPPIEFCRSVRGSWERCTASRS